MRLYRGEWEGFLFFVFCFFSLYGVSLSVLYSVLRTYEVRRTE